MVAGLVLAAAAVAFLAPDRGPAAPITVAVLPFVNTAADTTVDFLADAIPDEVASALTRVPGILIRSRSGARSYRGQLTIDATEAGTKLNADYVMTGLLRRERGNWILSADVARAADKTSIWTESFRLDPNQQAGAVALITQSLVGTLRERYPRSIGAVPVVASARTPLATQFYLGGQAALQRRGQSVKGSIDLFRQAIHEDTLLLRPIPA